MRLDDLNASHLAYSLLLILTQLLKVDLGESQTSTDGFGWDFQWNKSVANDFNGGDLRHARGSALRDRCVLQGETWILWASALGTRRTAR